MRAAHDMFFKEFNCSESKDARDRRPVSPNLDMHRPARRDRGQSRSSPAGAAERRWRASALSNLRSRSSAAIIFSILRTKFHSFLATRVTASAFRVPGPAILSAAAIFPNRWGCPPSCIRNRERSPHRSVRAEPRNRSPPRYRGEEYLPRHAVNRAARGPDDAKRWIHAPRAAVRSPQVFFPRRNRGGASPFPVVRGVRAPSAMPV